MTKEKEKNNRSFFIWVSPLFFLCPRTFFHTKIFFLLFRLLNVSWVSFAFLLLLCKSEPYTPRRDVRVKEEALAKRKKFGSGVFFGNITQKKKNELRLFILFYAGVLLLLCCEFPFLHENDPRNEEKNCASLIKPFRLWGWLRTFCPSKKSFRLKR